MTQDKLEILPTTKVGDLLDAYPEMEDILIGIAPQFEKLKNPILRKTIAKIATIKMVSKVSGIPLSELINKIRAAAGQPPLSGLDDN